MKNVGFKISCTGKRRRMDDIEEDRDDDDDDNHNPYEDERVFDR
jgi:hypothetical protein